MFLLGLPPPSSYEAPMAQSAQPVSHTSSPSNPEEMASSTSSSSSSSSGSSTSCSSEIADNTTLQEDLGERISLAPASPLSSLPPGILDGPELAASSVGITLPPPPPSLIGSEGICDEEIDILAPPSPFQSTPIPSESEV